MHTRPMTTATHNHHHHHHNHLNHSHNGTASMSSSSPGSPNSPANANAPVAFAEFKDADCASSAMCTLQGTYLLSSDRGPIRIEFAKSRMAIIGTDAQTFGGAGGGAFLREVMQFINIIFISVFNHNN